jgi:hypothetical protein
MNKSQEEKLHGQLNGAMKQSFLDLLTEEISSSTPNVEWFVRLYVELRDRLCSLLRPNTENHRNCYDSFDVEIFQQMISNKAFHLKDCHALIRHVFAWILRLQSPARDQETKDSEARVMEYGETVQEIIPLFIMEANESIDLIFQDLEALRN